MPTSLPGWRIPGAIQVPWIDTRNYTSLDAAIAAATAAGTGLVISNSITLDGSKTITIPITIPYGGMLVKASTYTVRFSGAFEAGLYQVFSGFSAGDIIFTSGSITRAYPNWWGAIGDGTTDCTSAIQAALDSVDTGGGVIYFAPGRYVITDELTVSKHGVWIEGSGPERISSPPNYYGTSIFLGANITGSMVSFEKSGTTILKGCGIKNICFDGNNRTYTADAAINVKYSDVSTFNNVKVFRINGSGIVTKRCVRSYFCDIDITDSGAASKPGFDINEFNSSDCTQGCTLSGIRIEGNYLDSYLSLSAAAQDNSFLGLVLETSATVSDSHKNYITLSGDRNHFSGVHMNKNDGTETRIILTDTAVHNVFSGVISAGSHGGDIFDIAGYQNTISDVNISGDAKDLWAFNFSAATSQWNTIHNAMINGFQVANFESGAISNSINGIRLLNKRAVVILDDSTDHLSTNLANPNRFADIATDEEYFINSASTITIPWGHDYIVVVGTTDINAISNATGWPGREITLRFSEVLTVNDTGSLALNGAFTSTGTSNDFLKLIWAGGTTWHEVSRSIN